MSRGNPYKGFSTRAIHGGAGFRLGQSAYNNELALAVLPEKVDSEDLVQEVLCRAYTGISRSEAMPASGHGLEASPKGSIGPAKLAEMKR